MTSFQPDLIIDGSIGEGGGSILRLAVGLACTLKKSVEIQNIRANRKRPGLRLQHLVGVKTLTEITKGYVNDLEIGSTIIKFNPGNHWISEMNVKIQTAGNIGMLSQSLYNGLNQAPYLEKGYVINVEGGGTYGKWAPGIDYLNNVTFKILQNFGYSVKIIVQKHGFYPKGGARVKIILKPSNPSYSGYVKEERGELCTINLAVHVEERLKNAQVAERIIKSVKGVLQNKNLTDYLQIDSHYHQSLSVGVGVDAWINFGNDVVIGAGTIIGERGISSETIGKQMGKNIMTLVQSDVTIDEYAADQILPILFLSDSPSKFVMNHPTSHFDTNLEILKQFTDKKAEIRKLSSGSYLFSFV